MKTEEQDRPTEGWRTGDVTLALEGQTKLPHSGHLHESEVLYE